jgi:formylglycine-generating enzyme required for sulfatase activity
VRLKAANPWGLHEMLGNVFEYTWDANDFTGPAIGTDPQRLVEGGGITRVARGGGFDLPASLTRAASRYAMAPQLRRNNAGLRLARTRHD